VGRRGREVAHERDRLGRVLRGAARARSDERRTHPRAPRGPRERGVGARCRGRVRPEAAGEGGGGMTSPGSDARGTWPLWEVFVRAGRGLSHVHAGSLHAPDADLALRNARDLYTRRGEGVSVWVVPSEAITASDPDHKG